MRLTVAPGQWPGDDLATVLTAADIASEADAEGVWFSEVNGYDATALAALAARRQPSLEVTIGPVAAGVRSPAQMAMAAATVAAVSEVAPRVVVGAGNRHIVNDWHGREAGDPAGQVRDHVIALRQALSGDRTDGPTSKGFRLVVKPPDDVLVGVAALSPRMLAVAGAYADSVVLNLVPPHGVAKLRTAVLDRAKASGRTPPRVIAWMIVGNPELSGPRITSFLRPYLTAEGYAPVLAAAGVTGPIDPDVALAVLTGLGPPSVAVDRALAYIHAGVDEVVLVGSAQDPGFGQVTAAVSKVFHENGARTSPDPMGGP